MSLWRRACSYASMWGRTVPVRQVCTFESAAKSGWMSRLKMQTVALRKKIAELEQQIPNYRREASGASGASAGPSDEAASQDAEAVDLQDAAAAAVQHDDQDQVCGDPENVERPSKDLDKLGTDFERLRQVLRSSRR
mmetsp:Transcript_7323/g.22329  ORF Transcript_7323/g.22329 Transcript_7323/m.22329 type:complete len:137 (+) Transcript_7323:557-967(+)